MEHNNTTVLAECKDHLVSHQDFVVLLNNDTGIAATDPQPSLQELPAYYQSDQYISHGIRRQTLVTLLYTKVQKAMFKKKRKWLSAASTRARSYLDYGCGTGAFVRYLNTNGWKAFGVEPNAKARSVYNDARVAPSLDHLNKQKFDVIGLWHVLEHVPNPEETISQLIQALNPEGSLFLALPNFNSFDASIYGGAWAGYDVPRHLWHFSAKGIVQLCEALGLQHNRSQGMFFDAFYISYLSEKNQKKSFPLLRAVFVGLWSNFRGWQTGEHSAMMYHFTKRS